MGTNISHQIILLDKYTKLWFRRAFSALDLSTAEAMVITSLAQRNRRDNPSPTHDELATQLHYDKGFTTRTMKSLEAKGLVRKMENPHDARSSHFDLTPEATQLLPRIKRVTQQWNDLVFDGLSEDEVRALGDAVDDLLDRVLTANNDKPTKE